MAVPEDIRIQSDGIGANTVIITAEGDRIKYLRRFHIYCDGPAEMVVAEIEVSIPTLDTHTHVREVDFSCPVCNEHMVHHCNGDSLGEKVTPP